MNGFLWFCWWIWWLETKKKFIYFILFYFILLFILFLFYIKRYKKKYDSKLFIDIIISININKISTQLLIFFLFIVFVFIKKYILFNNLINYLINRFCFHNHFIIYIIDCNYIFYSRIFIMKTQIGKNVGFQEIEKRENAQRRGKFLIGRKIVTDTFTSTSSMIRSSPIVKLEASNRIYYEILSELTFIILIS